LYLGPGPFWFKFFFLIYFLFYSFQKINIFSDLGPFCHPEPQGFCINLIFISDPGPLVELSLRVFLNFLFLVFNLFNPLILTRTLAILWDRISFSLILFTFLFTLKNQYSLGPGPFCAPEPQGLFKLVWFVLILKYKIYLGPRPFCGIESQGFFFLFLIFYLFNPLLWNWTSRFFYNLFTFLFIFKNQYFLGPGPFCQPEAQGFFKLVWF
jgi:hypothetical protein